MSLPRIKLDIWMEIVEAICYNCDKSESDVSYNLETWSLYYHGKDYSYHSQFTIEVIKKNNHQVWINMN